MKTKTERFKGFRISLTLLTLPDAALAQTVAGHPEDIPEPPKIDSLYVERTAAISGLVEGAYYLHRRKDCDRRKEKK